MAETETTKNRRHNRFNEIMKTTAVVGSVVSSGGVGSIVLWGGGLAVVTAITAFLIRIKNKQSPGKTQGAVNPKISGDPRKKLKNNCCVAMNRGIENECINGFRLALHNPSQPLHHHAWSSFSLSNVEVEGQEFVSTRYLISEEKIVLLIEWRHGTATSTKEEIVIFDNLKTRKNTSCDDNPRVLSLEESALQMLSVSPDDFAGKDPLGTLIQSIKDNRKALAQIVSAKQAPGVGEDQDGDGMQDDSCSKPIEGSSIEEIETGRDGNGEDANKETGEEGSALIPRAMETAKAGILESTVYKMRMQIWLLLVVVVMLALLASPKLLSH